MATDAELRAWAQSRLDHEAFTNAKPRSRYMADVRHPLKPRPLDDRPTKVAKGPRRPFEKKPTVPKEAPCSKCGTTVSLDRWWFHACFGTRFVK